MVSSPDARASRIKSYRNRRGGPRVELARWYRVYCPGSSLFLVVIVEVFGQHDGHAGPMRWRCKVELGAASHASTIGEDTWSDQFRLKAHGGDDTVR